MNLVESLERLSIDLLKNGFAGTYKIILPKSDFLRLQYELTKFMVTAPDPMVTTDNITLNLSGGPVYIQESYDYENFK